MNYEERDPYGIYRGSNGDNSAVGGFDPEINQGPGPRLMGANTLIGNDVYNQDGDDLGDIPAFDAVDRLLAIQLLGQRFGRRAAGTALRCEQLDQHRHARGRRRRRSCSGRRRHQDGTQNPADDAGRG